MVSKRAQVMAPARICPSAAPPWPSPSSSTSSSSRPATSCCRARSWWSGSTGVASTGAAIFQAKIGYSARRASHSASVAGHHNYMRDSASAWRDATSFDFDPLGDGVLHRLTSDHDFQRPNDKRGLDLMNACARACMDEFKDMVLAYGQSDEYRSGAGKFKLAPTDVQLRAAAGDILFQPAVQVVQQLMRRAVADSATARSSASSRRSLPARLCCSGPSSSSTRLLQRAAFRPDQHMQAGIATALQYAPQFDARVVCYPALQHIRDYLSWRQADCAPVQPLPDVTPRRPHQQPQQHLLLGHRAAGRQERARGGAADAGGSMRRTALVTMCRACCPRTSTSSCSTSSVSTTTTSPSSSRRGPSSSATWCAAPVGASRAHAAGDGEAGADRADQRRACKLLTFRAHARRRIPRPSSGLSSRRCPASTCATLVRGVASAQRP